MFSCTVRAPFRTLTGPAKGAHRAERTAARSGEGPDAVDVDEYYDITRQIGDYDEPSTETGPSDAFTSVSSSFNISGRPS